MIYLRKAMPKPRSLQPASVRRQRGVTLIEVLVTALVVAVGLLGVAALQVIAIQSTQQAYHRSQATALAYEMGDWIRAHRSRVLDGQAIPGFDGADPASPWQVVAAQRLPGGTLVIDQIDLNVGQVQITVGWTDGRLVDAQLPGQTGAEQVQIRTRF